jgi:hypothetical protein
MCLCVLCASQKPPPVGQYQPQDHGQSKMVKALAHWKQCSTFVVQVSSSAQSLLIKDACVLSHDLHLTIEQPVKQ